MRVIAGSARHLQLITPEGTDTRPTTDRIKETLFNMISDLVVGSRFLDCFSGSGGIGIEALSRGAASAVFIDDDRNAVRCIRQNLKTTGMEESAEVYCADVLTAVRKLSRSGRCFDLIFMDPPYDKGLEKKVLQTSDMYDITADDAVIIVEASLSTDLSYVNDLGYDVIRNKEYKTNKHVFLKKHAEMEKSCL